VLQDDLNILMRSVFPDAVDVESALDLPRLPVAQLVKD
jgi:hypothetical protein